jgi:hypothetical protein
MQTALLMAAGNNTWSSCCCSLDLLSILALISPVPFFSFAQDGISPQELVQAHFGFMHDDCRHLLGSEHFRPGLQFTGYNINREMLLDLFQCYVLGESADLYGPSFMIVFLFFHFIHLLQMELSVKDCVDILELNDIRNDHAVDIYNWQEKLETLPINGALLRPR